MSERGRTIREMHNAMIDIAADRIPEEKHLVGLASLGDGMARLVTVRPPANQLPLIDAEDIGRDGLIPCLDILAHGIMTHLHGQEGMENLAALLVLGGYVTVKTPEEARAKLNRDLG